MRRTDARPRDRARLPTTRRIAVAAVLVALALPIWQTYDLMLRGAYLAVVAAALALEVRRRTRPESPAEAYARALAGASAMHLHLDGVRVAGAHPGSCSSLITITWRSATTVLLDADGRARGQVSLNGLTTAYTMSIRVDDPVVFALLAGETGLGRVSVYGTTDLAANPQGTLLDGGLVLDQYDLAFPTWTGSLLIDAELADWES